MFAASLLAQLEREQARKKQGREQLRPDQLRAGAGVEFQRGQGALGVLPTAAAALPGQAAINQMMANAAAVATAAASKRTKWDSGK